MSSSKDTVSLTLPNGNVLTKRSAGNRWQIDQVEYGTANGPLFLNLLLPVNGTHHVISLGKSGKGRYVIHVKTPGGAAQVMVAFLPGSEVGEALRKREEAARSHVPGEVKIDPQTLPYDCFAGDTFPITVKLLGDISDQPPQFQLRLQRQTFVAATEIGARYSDPEPVETAPVTLARGADGAWRGSLTLSKPGLTFVSLRATGNTAAGKPFATEVLLSNEYVAVNPVVARLLSLTTDAIDVDGDGKLDRLDVTANLDVFIPGKFALGFSITDAAGRKVLPGSRGMILQQGRQLLTNSLPSKYIRSHLKDGPFQIADVFILRSDRAYLVKVPLANPRIETPPWKREQWDPGPVFGDDTVTVHGIRPAESGRFRSAEFQWNVTTPGGACSWVATLSGTRIDPSKGNIPEMKNAAYDGTLAAGRSTLSFIFDGATIARPGKIDWNFAAVLYCGSDKDGVRVDQQNVPLKPDQYEPARSSSVPAPH